MNELSRRIYEITEAIPIGHVMSYGRVAEMAGNKKAARAVGFAMHRNPRPGEIPCHRVVFKDGSLSPGFAFGGIDVQREMLLSEGVIFLPDGRVCMKSCGI